MEIRVELIHGKKWFVSLSFRDRCKGCLVKVFLLHICQWAIVDSCKAVGMFLRVVKDLKEAIVGVGDWHLGENELMCGSLLEVHILDASSVSDHSKGVFKSWHQGDTLTDVVTIHAMNLSQ